MDWEAASLELRGESIIAGIVFLSVDSTDIPAEVRESAGNWG